MGPPPTRPRPHPRATRSSPRPDLLRRRPRGALRPRTLWGFAVLLLETVRGQSFPVSSAPPLQRPRRQLLRWCPPAAGLETPSSGDGACPSRAVRREHRLWVFLPVTRALRGSVGKTPDAPRGGLPANPSAAGKAVGSRKPRKTWETQAVARGDAVTRSASPAKPPQASRTLGRSGRTLIFKVKVKLNIKSPALASQSHTNALRTGVHIVPRTPRGPGIVSALSGRRGGLPGCLPAFTSMQGLALRPLWGVGGTGGPSSSPATFPQRQGSGASSFLVGGPILQIRGSTLRPHLT